MKKRIQKISKYAPSIFQSRIDFSRAARGASLTAEHPFEKAAFHALFVALFACALLYVYFVGASVLNVIERREAMQESAQLASTVSALEREYFASSRDVTPEKGDRLGLAPVADTDYVYRPGNAASVATIDRNEI